MVNNVLFEIGGGKVTPLVYLPVSATILDLKKRIQTIIDVKVERQTLRFNGEELTDQQTIAHYNFEALPIVALEVKPLAGEPEFSIFVKCYGEEVEVKVKETTLVSDLKGKIEARWGSPSKRKSANRPSVVAAPNIILYRLDSQMEDHLPLSAYYVCEGTTIEVKIK